MAIRPHAFFLQSDSHHGGQRFCLYHPPSSTPARGLVLYVHPFAEEMNKSRRMAAVQSRAFALAGYAVLQIDLLGCGDSSGDFGDATWDHWVDDVIQGCQWLRQQADPPAAGRAPAPLWLWGLRSGCLVAVAAANRIDEPCRLLFWQPPASGKTLLQQFLRLKVAGDMLGGQGKGVMEEMRRQLAAGSSVDVAGYAVSAALAAGMESASLSTASGIPADRRVAWIELSTREDAGLSPVSAKTIDQWRSNGTTVAAEVVAGPSFWQTTEIEEAPLLVGATLRLIGDAHSS